MLFWIFLILVGLLLVLILNNNTNSFNKPGLVFIGTGGIPFILSVLLAIVVVNRQKAFPLILDEIDLISDFLKKKKKLFFLLNRRLFLS